MVCDSVTSVRNNSRTYRVINCHRYRYDNFLLDVQPVVSAILEGGQNTHSPSLKHVLTIPPVWGWPVIKLYIYVCLTIDKDTVILQPLCKDPQQQ